jgi:hypothetical protein
VTASTGSGRAATVRTDRPWALSAILAFTLSLGIAPLGLPLVALASGYDAVAIGLLTASAAISQLLFRLILPWLLGRLPDRMLIAISCLLLSLSYALLLATTIAPVFVLAQLCQGGGRALFWTASQTHAVRTPGAPVKMLAQVGVLGNLGTMMGPLLTGILAAQSLDIALGFGVVLGVVGFFISFRLTRLDPYERRSRRGETRMWLRPGIDVACWSAFAAGGWRSLASSYVPVVLTGAGMAPALIGLLLSAADLASTFVIWTMSRLPVERLRTALDVSLIVMAVGLAILPFIAEYTVLAAIALVVSGGGAGPLSILGAALARTLVPPSDEGDALALVGTFRAGAMLVTPAAVAVSLALLAVGPALAVASIALALPGTVLTLRQRS